MRQKICQKNLSQNSSKNSSENPSKNLSKIHQTSKSSKSSSKSLSKSSSKSWQDQSQFLETPLVRQVDGELKNKPTTTVFSYKSETPLVYGTRMNEVTEGEVKNWAA